MRFFPHKAYGVSSASSTAGKEPLGSAGVLAVGKETGVSLDGHGAAAGTLLCLHPCADYARARKLGKGTELDA